MPVNNPPEPSGHQRPYLATLSLLRRLNPISGKWEILAVRRNLRPSSPIDPNIPAPQDLWGLPGGKVEFGETVLAAAQRELHEETGLWAEPVRIVDWFEQISAHSHFALAVVMLTNPQGQIQLTDELAEASWIAIESLKYFDCHPQLERLASLDLDKDEGL